jgi:primary-amine oxidase
MPVTRVGFHLKPFGFFDGNPMLDLPAEGSHCAPTVAGGGCCPECTCAH